MPGPHWRPCYQERNDSRGRCWDNPSLCSKHFERAQRSPAQPLLSHSTGRRHRPGHPASQTSVGTRPQPLSSPGPTPRSVLMAWSCEVPSARLAPALSPTPNCQQDSTRLWPASLPNSTLGPWGSPGWADKRQEPGPLETLGKGAGVAMPTDPRPQHGSDPRVQSAYHDPRVAVVAGTTARTRGGGSAWLAAQRPTGRARLWGLGAGRGLWLAQKRMVTLGPQP